MVIHNKQHTSTKTFITSNTLRFFITSNTHTQNFHNKQHSHPVLIHNKQHTKIIITSNTHTQRFSITSNTHKKYVWTGTDNHHGNWKKGLIRSWKRNLLEIDVQGIKGRRYFSHYNDQSTSCLLCIACPRVVHFLSWNNSKLKTQVTCLRQWHTMAISMKAGKQVFYRWCTII